MPRGKKKNQDDLKPKVISFRVSEREFKFIVDLAEQNNSSAGAFVKDVVLQPAVREGVKSKFKDAAAAAEIAKILESEEAKNDNTD